ncbi:hypothetical protein M433DRAFT_68828 [Acidomyces richmondensis BFW]|nr:MAG: hypothetical protein FE78DRAFT_170388 [Acidomyces sp. 'richmondensis']KYG44688.1 hypothetical protein M433DRAFT_68828 [Acidomyces richmondensis BFW]
MYQYLGRHLTLAITSVCSSGFLLFGYDQGVMSGNYNNHLLGIITSSTFLDAMGDPDSTIVGTIVSIFHIGAFLGAIFTSIVGERLGRRRTLICGTAIDTVGAILQCTSYGQAQMFVGRIISGLAGIGMVTSAVPVYQSEVLKAGTRGWVGACLLSIVISGLVLAYWLDYGFSFANSSIQWRFPIAFQLVFALYAGIGALFLPDTPRWLYGHSQVDESMKVLSALRNLPANDPSVQLEYADTAAALELERKERSDWTGVFRDGGVKGNRRVLLAMGAQLMQQATGINVALFYAPTIFEKVIGMPHNLALLVAGALQTWWLISSFLTWYLIDRFGRRKLYMTMAVGMSLCMTGLSISVWKNTHASGIGATICLFMFEAFFVWGWHSGIWIYPPEILPFKLRAQGSALSTSMNWIGSFVIGEVSNPGFARLGYRFYIIFAAFNLSFIPIVYFFYPETAGKTLESVDLIFVDGRYKWSHLHKDARSVVRNADQHLGETSEKLRLKEELALESAAHVE